MHFSNEGGYETSRESRTVEDITNRNPGRAGPIEEGEEDNLPILRHIIHPCHLWCA